MIARVSPLAHSGPTWLLLTGLNPQLGKQGHPEPMPAEGDVIQRRLDVLTRHIIPGGTAGSSTSAVSQHEQSVAPTLQRQPTAGNNAGVFAGQVVVITGQDESHSSSIICRFMFNVLAARHRSICLGEVLQALLLLVPCDSAHKLQYCMHCLQEHHLTTHLRMPGFG